MEILHNQNNAHAVVKEIVQQELDYFLRSGERIHYAYRKMWKRFIQKFEEDFVNRHKEQIFEWCDEVQTSYTIDQWRIVLESDRTLC